MRTYRQKVLLVPMVFGLLTFYGIVQLIFALSLNSNELLAPVLITSYAMLGTFVLGASISAFIVWFLIHNKVKREKSALLMAILISFIGFVGFVLINTYLKSGLSKKSRHQAKHIIYQKHIDEILQDKKVIQQLEDNPELKREINGIVVLREKNIVSVNGANSFIFDILYTNEIKFEWQVHDQDIIEIGQFI